MYFTPNINIAADYSKIYSSVDGKKYKLVFQNRVKPSFTLECSKLGCDKEIWYIRSEADIKPYSICIIEAE